MTEFAVKQVRTLGAAAKTCIITEAWTVRTQLSLSSVGAVVNGTYANPSEVLGPHDVEY